MRALGRYFVGAAVCCLLGVSSLGCEDHEKVEGDPVDPIYPEGPCFPNPCTSPGRTVCIETEEDEEHECLCAPGYILDEHDQCVVVGTDPLCDPNPCLRPHQSVCVADGGAVFCFCDEGFWEDDAGQCVDPCEFVDCGSGSCVVTAGDASCDCDDGYSSVGLTCVPDVQPGSCDPNPCTSPNRNVCEVVNGVPVCSCNPGYTDDGTGTCRRGCTAVDTSRCNEATVESCLREGNGTFWVPIAECDAPGQGCVSEGSWASCALVDGDECGDPIHVTDLPFSLAGHTMTADFSDTMELTGASCQSTEGAVEAVFSVDLLAGEQLLVREMTSIQTIVSIQSTCGPAAACHVSRADVEPEPILYTAQRDETVSVIVETLRPTPLYGPYEIRLDLYGDEVCDDEADNDLDELFDCDDDDCFGRPGCEVERNCADGQDNDDDGLFDCDDTEDCGAEAVCGPFQGVYQYFQSWDDQDLPGHSIVFTPDAEAPNGYTHAVTGGLQAYPETPGAGDDVDSSGIGNNSARPIELTQFASFPFYGVSYTSIYIAGNGFITLGEPRNDPVEVASELFEQPIIAGLSADLHPGQASTAGQPEVTVDQHADRVVLTFHQVPLVYRDGVPLGPNNFQYVLRSNGVIELHYLAVSLRYGYFVGISNGAGQEPHPEEVDLIP